MPCRSTKTWEHVVSTAFRQWKASSHCSKIHGYALTIRIEFEADQLDERNWVIDFGALKGIKRIIEDFYDHMLIVAEDDPERALFEKLAVRGAADIRIVKNVGCEAFAGEVAQIVNNWLKGNAFSHNPRLAKVEISEHSGNSAIWLP